MAPDAGHDGVHGLAPEAGVGHAKVLASGNEGQGAKVEVQNHEECVRYLVAVVLRILDTRYRVTVVVGLAPAQVPAPAVGVAAHEALVSGGVEGGVLGGHAHHGVGAMLSARPRELKHVESAGVALLATYTVRALGHGMTMEAEWIVVLDEDVQTPVVRVPGVLDLVRLVDRGLVHGHLHSDRQRVGHNDAAGEPTGAGTALFKVSISVTFDLLHSPGDGSSHGLTTGSMAGPVRRAADGARVSPGALSGPVVGLTLRPLC